MKINLNKLFKPFMASYNELSEEFGEDFLRYNGVHNENLNFTDFMDSFMTVGSKVADTTIDSNANNSTRDIRSLMSDMMKPHTKLLAWNKIFYEITKKYGLSTAKAWMREEWTGGMYLHDFSTASFLPYCIMPQECCMFIYKGQYIYASLEDMYDKVEDPEIYDDVNGVYYKKTKELCVQDFNRDALQPTYTKVTCISKKDTDKDLYITKLYNGSNVITTDDHQFISTNGDIHCRDLIDNQTECYSTFDNSIFTNSIVDYCGLELNEDIGWLLGMYLAEGYWNGQCVICQDSEKSADEWNRILNICEKYDIPYHIINNRRIALKQGKQKFSSKFRSLFRGKLCNEKRLVPDFIHFNDDFLRGVLSGLLDGDGTIAKNCQCSIRLTSRTLINQIRLIGLHFGVYFTGRLPYIQSENAKIQQKRPMYSCIVNMNRNKDFFMSLTSIKIPKMFTHFDYNEKYANNNYTCEMGILRVKDVQQTYKPSNTVYDLSTESHTFVCNNILVHNCFAYDLDAVAERGLFFINRFKTDPPKHLTTFNDHVLEFISWTANRTSGACGLPSYLIYSYYFWKKDVDDNFFLRDPEYYRRQCFQKFIYDLNQPYLRIVECAFTNITIMDRPYMYELFGGRKFPDGSDVVDYVDEIIEHQKVFMEVVSKIRSERMFTFPVLTYSLLYQDGKFVDEEFARWCSDHNTKWCDSNFYVGNDVTSLSSCCRLVNDFSKLEGFINSIGGTSLKIGSVKVNTINLRRVFLEAKAGLDSGVVDEDYYLELLKDKVDLCVKALDCVRGIISRNVEKGLLPNYQEGIIDMKRQFNTIGINGMYETIRDFGYIETDEDGNESYTDKGIVFASRILDFISSLKDSYGFDYSINVEAVPGERCAAVLSTKDNALYPDDNVGDFLYGNQWIPLGKQCTINEKIRLGAILDRKCGGGQISHINVEGDFTSSDQAWEILNHIASKGVIYFAFNKKISVCSENHAFFGDKCPICGGEKVDEYCRIVGYLVPITSYSKERKKEYDMREWYELKEWM